MSKDRTLEEQYEEYLRKRATLRDMEPIRDEIVEAPSPVEAATPKKKKKKRRKKHYFLRLLLVIAVVVGLYFFMTSSLFDVAKITVQDNSYFTVEQIIDRSGITQGQNIFFGIKAGDAKEALMEDPYIKTVTIERELPDTIKIIVEERTEAMAIPYTDRYVIADAEGLVLRLTEVEPKLPLVEGMTLRSMDPGKALDIEENGILNDILSMINAMQNSEVYFKRIDVSKVMTRAYIYDTLVCQGMPEDLAKALGDGTLSALLYELYVQGIEHGTITITSDTTNMAFSPVYE